MQYAIIKGEDASMPKTEMIRVRMESELKQEAEKIFSALGLTPTERLTCSTGRLFHVVVCLSG